MDTPTHPTLRRTGVACRFGSITQAITNNLPPLLFVIFQDQYGVTFEKLGLLVLLNFLTQFLVDGLCARYADRIGYRPLIVAAHVLSAAGLLLLGVLPGLMQPYPALMISVLTMAVGSGLIEVLVSPLSDALPGDGKAARMALLHSFYCWGHVVVVLLTTAGLYGFGGGAWRVLPPLWAVIPLANAIQFARGPLVEVKVDDAVGALSKLVRNKMFLLFIALMICAGASEQAMAQWASLFAEVGLKVDKAFGNLLGPCLFAVLMGTGRLLYGLGGERLKLRRALSLCAGLCVVCYLVTSLVANPLVSLIGCAVTGFSVSLMWPGVLSLGARTFVGGGTAMFSLLALGGDIGCAFGPWLTGLVSDVARAVPALARLGEGAGLDATQVGLRAGLLIAVIFPAAMLVAMAAVGRMKKKRG